MTKAKPKLTPIPKPGKRKPPTPQADRDGAGFSAVPDAGPDLSMIAEDLRPLAVPVASLDFLPNNPRKHGEKDLAQLRGSLKEFQQLKNIVVNTARTPPQVVAGNGTLMAALALGWSHVAVVRKRMTDAEAAAYAVSDNATALGSSWDDAALAKMLDGLAVEDAGLQQMLADLEESLPEIEPERPEGETPEDPGAQVDRAAELQAKWGTAPGQLWVIPSKTTPGKAHRLLCGDSTKAEDVARAMGGEKADLCFTSPPYDQQRTYDGGIGDWLTLMKGVFANLPMADAGQALVNLGLIHRDGEWVPYWDPWIEWMRGQGWRRFGWYVWDQGSGLPGDWSGRFAPSFEFMFHFNRSAVKPEKWVPCKLAGQIAKGRTFRNKNGTTEGFTGEGLPYGEAKIPDSVVRVWRQVGSDGHPAQFPVDLVTFAMKSWPGLCYEPFSGSGTTIVAAEQTGRLCHGIEISAAYVSVALERLSQMGLEPRLEQPQAVAA